MEGRGLGETLGAVQRQTLTFPPQEPPDVLHACGEHKTTEMSRLAEEH